MIPCLVLVLTVGGLAGCSASKSDVGTVGGAVVGGAIIGGATGSVAAGVAGAAVGAVVGKKLTED